ncbi:unnamed protein product [Linum trigynum]|uniref:Pre-mRNA polyadenylation factor Fip1 domain-containing protein n=1 Tax=Linum trigynum TaxID=586398 RepID=A0AAV2GUX2_9ROSI
MEDFPGGDDDFGDLYADVELQAASAINSRTSSAKFHFPLEQQTVIQVDGTVSNSKAGNARLISEGGNVSSCPNPLKLQNDWGTVPLRSFQSTRMDLEHSEFLQGNVANVNQVSNVYAAANSVVSHGGYGFSLPLYRTIYDVNTDTFGGKRWGYQGANMSVLPKFGINEDCWRQYCMSVPKGRAIEVEDSGGERFPTMNQKYPDNWDSDVVIQIKVQEFDENSSAFSKGDLSSKSSGVKGLKTCKRSADVVAEACHSCGASGDRVSLGSPSPEGTRSSKSLLEMSESSQHLDNSERDHIPDSDEHHPRRTRARTSDLAEAVESERDSKDESGRRSSQSDRHQSDSDSLIDDRSHFSLALSCSESDSEDSCHGVSRCSSLGTELHDTVSSGHCKSNGTGQTDSDRRHITDGSLLNGRRRSENRRDQRVKNERDLDFPKRSDPSYSRFRETFPGDGGQRWGTGYAEADYREYPQSKRHRSLEGEAYIRDRANCNQSAHRQDRRISEILQPKHRYGSLYEEYGRCSPFSGREINVCERGLRHGDKARLDSDRLWNEEKMERDYWNDYHQDGNNGNQDASFRSHTRSYATNHSRWQNGNIFKRYDPYEARVMETYSRPRKELYDSGTYGGIFGSEENLDSGFDDQHELAESKYVWRSRLHKGEESKSRQGGVQSYLDRFSCYGKALRHENITGYEILRERHSDNLVESNLTYKCEREKMVGMYFNGPVGLVSQKEKLSGKQPTTGRQIPKSNPKKKNQKRLNASLSGKANIRQEKPQTQGNNDVMKRLGATFQGKVQKNESDIEEGEIITGEPNAKNVKAPQSEKAGSCNTVTTKAVYDEQWILERLAKMEKRRERFKVPVLFPEKVSTTDLNPPSCSQPQVVPSVSTGQTKLERPARKRRWAGI